MNQFAEDPFESRLRNIYTAPALADRFVAQLEARLAAEAAGMQTSRRRIWRPRLAFVFAALCLAFASTIGIIGPDRVWAAVRGLLGYVPGIGIVPVSADAMVLAEPVEYTRGGVTLRVEQLLANSDRTLLTYLISGLPVNERAHRAYLEVAPGENLYSREYGSEGCSGPDCPPNWNYRIFQKFYELPRATTHVTLVWKRYTPNQLDVTEEWRIPLQLKPLTQELRARLYPPAYTLSAASATSHDVTLQVRNVTQDPTTTVLNTRLVWPEKFDTIDIRTSEILIDNLGNRSTKEDTTIQFSDQGQPIQDASPVAPGGLNRTAIDQTLVFQPVDQNSRQLTFQVDELWWRAYYYTNLPIDLGTNPTIGSEWPLDVTLDVAGEKLHLTGMRLVEMDWTQGKKVPLLEFRADPIPEESGLRIDFLYFDGGDNKAPGYTVGQGPVDEFIPGVVLTSEQLKTGKLTLFGSTAEGILRGPWQVSWDIPKQ